MESRLYGRTAFSVLELIVSMAIIAVLLGLLLAAVAKVREAALVVQSKNNLKQISLALESFATAYGGSLPTVDGASRVNDGISLFDAILPYAEQKPGPATSNGPFQLPPIIKLLVSPADPTAIGGIAQNEALSSYAANARVFIGNPSLLGVFADGSSNTITFAEHYSFDCDGDVFLYWSIWSSTSLERRATFADDTDVYPVTTGSPPITRSSLDGYTFQVAPSQSGCMSYIAQTPHRGGMLVALGDGSVCQLDPCIAETTYWGMVTPAGGEILGSGW